MSQFSEQYADVFDSMRVLLGDTAAIFRTSSGAWSVNVIVRNKDVSTIVEDDRVVMVEKLSVYIPVGAAAGQVPARSIVNTLNAVLEIGAKFYAVSDIASISDTRADVSAVRHLEHETSQRRRRA